MGLTQFGAVQSLAAGSHVATRFFHVGVVQISLPNLIVLVAMIVIFVLALVLPFPHGAGDEKEQGDPDARN